MASVEQHPDRESDVHDPDESMPVVVDPNFVRTFADYAFVMYLGRDVDLSFLAVGSSMKSVLGVGDDSRDTLGIDLEPQLNEVARVRLAPSIAVTLSMQILEEYARKNRLNTSALIDTINGWGTEPAAGEAAKD